MNQFELQGSVNSPVSKIQFLASCESELTPRKPIAFNLLANAQDSLRRAIQLLAFDEVGSREAHLKHAVVNTAHCVEMLLKERLRRFDPALVLKDPNKYPSLSAFTVNIDTAIKRLRSDGNVKISVDDEKMLKDLRSAMPLNTMNGLQTKKMYDSSLARR